MKYGQYDTAITPKDKSGLFDHSTQFGVWSDEVKRRLVWIHFSIIFYTIWSIVFLWLYNDFTKTLTDEMQNRKDITNMHVTV